MLYMCTAVYSQNDGSSIATVAYTVILLLTCVLVIYCPSVIVNCVRRVNNCCVILLRSINSNLFAIQPNTFIHKQYESYYSTVLQTAVSSKRTSVVIMADGYCNQYHIILTKLSSSTLDIMQSLWWVTEFMTYNWGLKDSMWKLV